MYIQTPQEYYTLRLTLAVQLWTGKVAENSQDALSLAEMLLEDSLQKDPSPLYFKKEENPPQEVCEGCEEPCAECPESPEDSQGS